MTPREEIFDELMDRIRHAMQNIENPSYLYKDLRGMIGLIESSSKQADAIKDGPSEEDIKDANNTIKPCGIQGCVHCAAFERSLKI